MKFFLTGSFFIETDLFDVEFDRVLYLLECPKPSFVDAVKAVDMQMIKAKIAILTAIFITKLFYGNK